ncbi:MAG: polyprenyl synthetase family protein, partial [Myxococcota bacterium]
MAIHISPTFDQSEHLRAFETQLERALHGDFPQPLAEAQVMLEAARHLCLRGRGKRVRPRLVHMFGEILKAPSKGLIDIAVASELIHSASLLHDDVVDEGTVRRGHPTARMLWGNHVSVLSGDLVLSTAFLQVKHHPFKVTERAIELVASMSRAAMMEVLAQGRTDISLATWKSVSEGKTGALFGWCGEAVAWLEQREDAAEAFRKIGTHLGVAFQIADDLKDILGNDHKDQFADLRNRNPSFCILQAAQASPSFAQDLAQAWQKESLSKEDIEALGREILALDVIHPLYQQLCQEIEYARDALQP